MKSVSLNNISATTTSHNTAGQKKQMIAPGAVPHLVQFAQATFKPGEVATEHKHPDLYEIFLVESGSGIIRIDDKEQAIEKGMSITVEPNELHEVENTGDKALVLTYFSIKD